LNEARQHSGHLLTKELEQDMMTYLWSDMERLLLIKRENDFEVVLDHFMNKYGSNRTFINGFWKPWLKMFATVNWKSQPYSLRGVVRSNPTILEDDELMC
jgi:myosin-crossreactive antigen